MALTFACPLIYHIFVLKILVGSGIYRILWNDESENQELEISNNNEKSFNHPKTRQRRKMISETEIYFLTIYYYFFLPSLEYRG